uniref:H(+)-transporting two-sector ATPase n=1 Tax=Jaagichlorella roystonensis TaxID=1052852 RepID=A0A6C0M711_9CHLO|nr:ATP synthase protein [Jaagichlorella roystonensis]QHU78319.1 ATP synthase protein [Jaagichlorella roystonensis]
MPQLDKVTFLSQFFWLLVFFFGFYIFQLKYFLPEMSRILKFRKKTLNRSSAFTLQEENSKVRNSASTVLENLFKNSRNVFKRLSLKSDNLFSDYANKYNQNNLKKGNIKYLQSIAEKSLSKDLAMLAVNHDFSEKMFSSRLLERILLVSRKSIASSSVIDRSSLKNRGYITTSPNVNNKSKLEDNKKLRKGSSISSLEATAPSQQATTFNEGKMSSTSPKSKPLNSEKSKATSKKDFDKAVSESTKTTKKKKT